jgi:hypothetical protein
MSNTYKYTRDRERDPKYHQLPSHPPRLLEPREPLRRALTQEPLRRALISTQLVIEVAEHDVATHASIARKEVKNTNKLSLWIIPLETAVTVGCGCGAAGLVGAAAGEEGVAGFAETMEPTSCACEIRVIV